ncbi:MAG: HAD family hydrolase [Gemmatimonadaceae bacterium]
MTSRLAIFDIDGTLTATNEVDDECFLCAVAEVFDLPRAAALDWSAAPHVTDSALARWLSQEHRGRAPGDDELTRLRARFLELLSDELARRPDRFAAVAGAPGLFPLLRAEGWEVALATGGWRASAQLKLAAAGLDCRDVPLACADDGLTREEIVREACARAGFSLSASTEIVSVGDGVWDVRTAQRLGLRFVGVGEGSRAEALYRAGAGTVLPDLTDVGAVLAALDAATVPESPRSSGVTIP